MHTTRTYRIIAGTAVAAATLGITGPAFADSTPWSTTDTTSSRGVDARSGAVAGIGAAVPESAPAPVTPAPAGRPADPKSWGITDTQAPVAPMTTSAARALRAPQHATTRRAVRRAQHVKAAPQRRVARVASSAPGTWTVHEGDTLGEIAAVNRTSVAAIVRANARRHPSLLADQDLIGVGWVLRIPGSTR